MLTAGRPARTAGSKARVSKWRGAATAADAAAFQTCSRTHHSMPPDFLATFLTAGLATVFFVPALVPALVPAREATVTYAARCRGEGGAGA